MLLPRLERPRGASPNVSKRTVGWGTPRDPPPTNAASSNADDQPLAAVNIGAETHSISQSHVVDTLGIAVTVDNALEMLELMLRESDAANEPARARASLLCDVQTRREDERDQREQARLASVEHMADTIQLLRAELEHARSSGRTLASVGNNTASAFELEPATEAIRSSEQMLPVVGTASTPLGSRKHAETGSQLRSPRLSESPLRARLTKKSDGAAVATVGLAKRAEHRLLQAKASHTTPLTPSLSTNLAQLSSREEKLRQLLVDRAAWQAEYELMRDKVVEEKTRQVELFRRLDAARRDHLAQIERLETTLRSADAEIELLRTQLTQAKTHVAHIQDYMVEFACRAKDEKKKLVCSIAETRHKFKEWKEGEAATLKAARDQAVHNLKTEYELKIARHHEEKQKLRDKVKDLEVSLRLLQRDRHLSPAELSLRKNTILGTKDGGATAEAELIEAQCRIKELEALLEYANEHQKRQENVIQISEGTIARLMQEREVVALESLSFESSPGAIQAQPLHTSGVGVSQDAQLNDSASRLSPRRCGSSSDHSPDVAYQQNEYSECAMSKHRSRDVDNSLLPNARGTSVEVVPPKSVPAGSGGVDSEMGSSEPRCSVPPAAQPLSLLTTPATASFAVGNAFITSNDSEKEILRHQSVVLSAEIEKYRQIVMQSMDEIRTLKDQRRRSHRSMIESTNNSSGSANTKEQFLMNELKKAQGEVIELKKQLHRKQKSIHRAESSTKQCASAFDEAEEGDSDQSNSGCTCIARHRRRTGSTSSSTGGNDADAPLDSEPRSSAEFIQQDSPHPVSPEISSMNTQGDPINDFDVHNRGAVQVLQKQGKAFVARRQFIKKKLAIEKIKARYRGYLVRKNMEILKSAPRQGHVHNTVSEAAQYKMQIVSPHHETVCSIHGQEFRVLIRVSKDPSVIQMQMLPLTQNTSQGHIAIAGSTESLEETHEVRFSHTTTRVAYFHLFEAIAALPYDEESKILEHTSETEIAKIVASLLCIVRVGGEYKFVIDRKSSLASGGGASTTSLARAEFGYTPAVPISGTMLTELSLDPVRPRRYSCEEDSNEPVEESQDLDSLIRDAHQSVAVAIPPLTAPAHTSSAEPVSPRQPRRLSVSSLDSIPER